MLGRPAPGGSAEYLLVVTSHFHMYYKLFAPKKLPKERMIDRYIAFQSMGRGEGEPRIALASTIRRKAMEGHN